jgi:hypothetical protein
MWKKKIMERYLIFSQKNLLINSHLIRIDNMMHLTSLLVISEYKKHIKTDPILKNNTGKTIIQTVSKSSLTPTNSFIIMSADGTIIVAIQLQCLHPKS